ncbi:hypothetical protein CBM2631_A90283 [Cupriavidus taiwanensis]|nr:hypothetical protein CBM2631_A90283 [Cupriavidus taiwanensis]
MPCAPGCPRTSGHEPETSHASPPGRLECPAGGRLVAGGARVRARAVHPRRLRWRRVGALAHARVSSGMGAGRVRYLSHISLSRLLIMTNPAQKHVLGEDAILRILTRKPAEIHALRRIIAEIIVDEILRERASEKGKQCRASPFTLDSPPTSKIAPR